MIVKFLEPSETFNGIGYNFDKLAIGDAELMMAANFGALDSFGHPGPEDYRNYLELFSSSNRRFYYKQLHVAISAQGQSFDKNQLTDIAKEWMARMGYADNPYLVFFHKDADNNHVHIVSTRIGRDGRKINSGFEHIRGIAAMNKIIGIDEHAFATKDIEKALSYHFTTLPQLKNLFETMGYKFENHSLIKYGRKLAEIPVDKVVFSDPGENRRLQLKAIFQKYHGQLPQKEMIAYLRTKLGIQLIFHKAEGHPEPYGYTIVDHAQKNIFKGSQVMPLKELLAVDPVTEQAKISSRATVSTATEQVTPIHINISGDINDEAVHGRRRRKKPHGPHR